MHSSCGMVHSLHCCSKSQNQGANFYGQENGTRDFSRGLTKIITSNNSVVASGHLVLKISQYLNAKKYFSMPSCLNWNMLHSLHWSSKIHKHKVQVQGHVHDTQTGVWGRGWTRNTTSYNSVEVIYSCSLQNISIQNTKKIFLKAMH